MKANCQFLCRFATLVWRWLRLFDHWIVLGRSDLRSCGSSCDFPRDWGRAAGVPTVARSGAMRPRVVTRKAVAIFAWGSPLARRRRSAMIEDAATLASQQFSTRHILRRLQKRGTGIVTVAHQDGTHRAGQACDTLPQLGRRHFCVRLRTCDPSRIEQVAPTADRIGQDHQGRKLPSRRDRRRATPWQIRHIQAGPIRRRGRLGTGNRTGIDAPQRTAPVCWQRHMRHKDALQGMLFNAPILKRFIQNSASDVQRRARATTRQTSGRSFP